jgi:ferrochelatase
MAYGSPTGPEDVERYYTDIRRGRPPTPELLAQLTSRYDAIGGLSPLHERTQAQRAAIEQALEEIAPGRYHVEIGLKHAAPTIEAAVERLVGCEAIIGLVLAPHDSAYSVGQYLDRLSAAAAGHGIPSTGVRSWATEPAFIDFVVADLSDRLRAAPDRRRVYFTAHSLPERILATGDVYVAELTATAGAIAARLGLEEEAEWRIGWQSAGRTPEPWLGPDILAVLDDEANRGDIDHVIVAAVGFVSDHLEVLYDLDIEAATRAAALGLGFDRTACVNADPTVMQALAHRIHSLEPDSNG